MVAEEQVETIFEAHRNDSVLFNFVLGFGAFEFGFVFEVLWFEKVVRFCTSDEEFFTGLQNELVF